MDPDFKQRINVVVKADCSSQVNLTDEERESSVSWNPFVEHNRLNSITRSPSSRLSASSTNYTVKSEFKFKTQSQTMTNFFGCNKCEADTEQITCCMPKLNSALNREFSRILGRNENFTLLSGVNAHAVYNFNQKSNTFLNQKDSCHIARRSSKLKHNTEASSDTGCNICNFPTFPTNKNYMLHETKSKEGQQKLKVDRNFNSKSTFRVDNELFLTLQRSRSSRLNTREVSKLNNKKTSVAYNVNSRKKSYRTISTSTSRSDISQQQSWELYLWECNAYGKERKLSTDPSSTSCDDLRSSAELTSMSPSPPTVNLGVHSLLAHVLYPEINDTTDTDANTGKKRKKVKKLDPRRFYVWESDTDGSEDLNEAHYSYDVIQKTKDFVKMSASYFWEMKNKFRDDCSSAGISVSRRNREHKNNINSVVDKQNIINVKECSQPYENCETNFTKNPQTASHLCTYDRNNVYRLISKEDLQNSSRNVLKPCEVKQSLKSTLYEGNKPNPRSRNKVEFKLGNNTHNIPQTSIFQDKKIVKHSKSTSKLIRKMGSSYNLDVCRPKLLSNQCFRIPSQWTKCRKILLHSPVMKSAQYNQVLNLIDKVLGQLADLDTLLERVESTECDLREELADLVRAYEDSCAYYNVLLTEIELMPNTSSISLPSLNNFQTSMSALLKHSLTLNTIQ